MKIYVASSWRNHHQPNVVRKLRELGHEVYDFREPKFIGNGLRSKWPGEGKGFAWSDIDPDWQAWTPSEFRDALDHRVAMNGFNRDMSALEACDLCVLVLPCGRSAHLELGYAEGADKWTIVYFPSDEIELEPELMYAMNDAVCIGIEDLIETVAQRAVVDEAVEQELRRRRAIQ